MVMGGMKSTVNSADSYCLVRGLRLEEEKHTSVGCLAAVSWGCRFDVFSLLTGSFHIARLAESPSLFVTTITSILSIKKYWCEMFSVKTFMRGERDSMKSFIKAANND